MEGIEEESGMHDAGERNTQQDPDFLDLALVNKESSELHQDTRPPTTQPERIWGDKIFLYLTYKTNEIKKVTKIHDFDQCAFKIKKLLQKVEII